MSLQPGTTLGPYAVTAKIGEGGMGEVYRARDTKLDRDVALKVLPEAFTADPDRLARFEREAKVLASLNHPNIAAIYGLEESDGVRALVLELVEGPTLADRIKQGPIPLDEALPIAKQIAEALEAAHEAGVIHRDLKPANIKVREDGTVKVLDFGLAKALDPSPVGDPSQSPTLTAMATQMGVIMGTAAYMSPEQARGSAADHRSDIWSFGVVLYEMVTGKGMFDGATVSDVLAAVLRSDPLWEQLPRDLLPGVRRLLKRCVERDRKERLQHIGDARVELRDAISSPLADASVMATPTRGWQGRWALATVLLLVATAAGLRVWTFPRANPTELLPTPIALTPPTNASVFADLGFAVSPNGRTVVFVGTDGQLYQRSLSELDPVLVPGTSDAYQPFFSPDGSWLAYIDRGDDTLKKLRLDGSERVTLCPVPNALRSTSWGPDDNIVFSYLGASSLWRVSANGGDPEPIPTDNTSNEAWDERTLLRWVDVLPTGTAVLASVGAPETQQEIVVVSLENGQKKVLLRGTTPRYLATGHIVYWREGSLWTAPFDSQRREITGAASPVLEGVTAAQGNGWAHFAVGGGTLVYRTGTAAMETTLVWVDREGREEAISAPPNDYVSVRLSPDGQQIAAALLEKGSTDVFAFDVARSTLTRITFDPGNDNYVSWSPDGQRISFASNRGGQINPYWARVDGTGEVEPLATHPGITVVHSWSPDGTTAVLTDLNPETGENIGVLDVDERRINWILSAAHDESSPAISPNGRWMAYTSNESGRLEVYVRPFPNVNDGRWRISTDGGLAPLWGPDSDELFFQTASGTDGETAVMAVRLDTEPTLVPGNPRRLLAGPYRLFVPLLANIWDISKDGQRFLMIKNNTDALAAGRDTIIVQHWIEELKRLVPID